MPITKSAAKAMRQSRAHAKRRQPYKTAMKTLMRKLRDAVTDGRKDDAVKLLPAVYTSIDTAAKKHIIHRKNADRKKSAMAGLLKEDIRK